MSDRLFIVLAVAWVLVTPIALVHQTHCSPDILPAKVGAFIFAPLYLIGVVYETVAFDGCKAGNND